MKLSEILRAGKANIETRGWCQGDEATIHGPPNGPCCVATAMPSGPEFDHSLLAIDLFKETNGIDPKIGIGAWNDAPERTKEEVLAAYDKAITAAEEQEA
jgi:hypothetical protein